MEYFLEGIQMLSSELINQSLNGALPSRKPPFMSWQCSFFNEVLIRIGPKRFSSIFVYENIFNKTLPIFLVTIFLH